MIAFLDTETSGLRKAGLDPLDPSQPHLLQLGCHLYATDWELVGRLKLLIRPDGWEVEPGAFTVHGIPTVRAQRYGVPLSAALVPFQALVANATRIIGHNVQFDAQVIATAIYRAGGSGNWWAKKRGALYCTMEGSAEPCGLPGQFGEPKFPSLEEALAILLPGQPFHVKHDAESDLIATVALYRELIRRGLARETEAFPKVA